MFFEQVNDDRLRDAQQMVGDGRAAIVTSQFDQRTCVADVSRG
jgi:hypothetical protein